MMQFTHLDGRRTQHTGVLSEGRWSAHDRRMRGATAPQPFINTGSADSETGDI